MPANYEIIEQADMLIVRYDGDVSVSDLRNMYAAIHADPGYHIGIRVLVDYSAIVSIEMDISLMLMHRDRRMVELAAIEAPTKLGYYAPTDYGFGMSRRGQLMYEDLPNLEVGVFQTQKEVREFFGLPEGALPAWP